MSSETKQILTTDGIPLEVSLKKAEKKNKIKAFLLVAPLLLFLVITYIFPIGDMFMRSVDDRMVTNMLPKTFKAMEKWENLDELPPEEVYRGFYEDYKLLAENQQHAVDFQQVICNPHKTPDILLLEVTHLNFPISPSL